MAQKKYTDGSGVSEIWLNIKNYVYSQLLGKQDTLVSGTNIKTVNNQSLLGSGNVSFTPPTFTYDSSTETLTVSNTTATVFMLMLIKMVRLKTSLVNLKLMKVG